jgi:osmotically-inducible protein OsmY
MKKDEHLCTEIRGALLHDKRVSARNVEVEVRNRIVTLKGAPQSFRRILAAIEVAASFSDCRGVINALRVRAVRAMADSEIAALVRTILRVHPEIRKETISVSVRNGEATLKGTVGTPTEGILAEDIALGINGVRCVRNLLLCDVMDQVEDARLCHDVGAELKRTPGLRDTDLRVAFDGEVIVLSGRVAEPWQRELAESVIDRFRPLCARNDITIEAPP